MKSHRITMEKFVYGGMAKGSYKDKTVLIQSTLPKDTIDFTIAKETKNIIYGKLEKLVAASPYRTQAPCPYYQLCGGCNLQELNSEYKDIYFQEILKYNLERISKLKLENDFMKPLKPSPLSLHYRCRGNFKFEILNSTVKAGFFMEKSHKLVDINHCLLMNENINTTFLDLKDYLKTNITKEMKVKFKVEIIYINKKVAAIFQFTRNFKHIFKILKKISFLDYIEIKTGNKTLFQTSKTFIFQHKNHPINPGAFIQVNLGVNELLKDFIKANIPKNNKHILDLYCGFGNLSLNLVSSACKLTGIEQNKLSTKTLNEVSHYSVLTGDAKKELNKLINENYNFDTIIVDPPTSGIKDIVFSIIKLNPSQIIYVSCNPATLCRDIHLLNEKYYVNKIQGFDMFPMTSHLEIAAILKIKD